MQYIRAVLLWAGMGCAGICAISGLVLAQATYPTKPINIIAPTQPGGGVELMARTAGEYLLVACCQPVVVENQPGGGRIAASLATATAAPDGSTLMVGYV